MSDFRGKAFISFYFILLGYTIAIKASFKKKKKKKTDEPTNQRYRGTEILRVNSSTTQAGLKLKWNTVLDKEQLRLKEDTIL